MGVKSDAGRYKQTVIYPPPHYLNPLVYKLSWTEILYTRDVLVGTAVLTPGVTTAAVVTVDQEGRGGLLGVVHTDADLTGSHTFKAQKKLS